MRIRKTPVLLNSFVNDIKIHVDLEYALHHCKDFEIELKDIYEDMKTDKEDYEIDNIDEVFDYYMNYSEDKITSNCVSIMHEETHKNIVENMGTWLHPVGLKKTMDIVYDGFDKCFRPYWRKRRSEELVESIMNYFATLVRFQSIDTKSVDEMLLKKKDVSAIIKEHFAGEKYHIDETIFYSILQGLEEKIYALGLVNDKKYDIDIERILKDGIEAKTETEYLDWETGLHGIITK